jgi:glycosyltransferase involved in cell wall biosynthesis
MELDRAYWRSLQHQIAWRIKNEWVRRSVRNAGAVLVQTASLADRIAKAGLRSRNDIAVVPHGPGQVRHAARRSRRDTEKPWCIGYFTKFGVQKNFETLFRAVRRLSDAGHNVRLVVTLDPSYGPAAKTLGAAKAIGIAHLVDNQGEVSSECVQDRYDSLDLMAFCSVCESFGFPMVEAMARGVPIVVADTPENREITAGAALTFSAHDDRQLAHHLERLILDETERSLRSDLSLARGREFSWSLACERTLSVLQTAAANAT